jgi:phosphoribosylamine--glycine ligase
LGDNVSDAQAQAYKLASKINWNGMFYRDDIAWRAIEREQNS